MQFTQNLVCLQQKGSDVSRTIFDQVSLVDLGDFFFIFRRGGGRGRKIIIRKL